jgi:hypothetical protein
MPKRNILWGIVAILFALILSLPAYFTLITWNVHYSNFLTDLEVVATLGGGTILMFIVSLVFLFAAIRFLIVGVKLFQQKSRLPDAKKGMRNMIAAIIFFFSAFFLFLAGLIELRNEIALKVEWWVIVFECAAWATITILFVWCGRRLKKDAFRKPVEFLGREI